MPELVFDKYEQRGAYHWEWYASNRHHYADNVNFVIDNLPPSGTVLDIGGGDGLISYRMFRQGLSVTCIDTNARAIELASQQLEYEIYGRNSTLRRFRKLASYVGFFKTDTLARYEEGQIRFETKSVFELSVESQFDYVVCHEVIEHVPNPQELLQIIHRLIRSYAIISTPDTTNHPPHKLDYHSWTPDTFSELLSPYRFEFIKQDGSSMYVKLFK